MLQLMLVTDDTLLAGRDVAEVARAAVRGGVTCVQLRLKRASPRELHQLARRLIAELAIPVLVNDRLDVALAAGAAGVHLGPDDVPVELARRIAPPGFVIGASVGTESEVPRGQGASYWGVGPWRVTSTKPDAGSAIGAEGFGTIVGRAGPMPCVAIGGILPEDIPQVLARGGTGVAVISGILGADDVETAARQYAGSYRRFRSTIRGK
jgi:thiamine-phosphate pyrophosphorylase